MGWNRASHHGYVLLVMRLWEMSSDVEDSLGSSDNVGCRLAALEPGRRGGHPAELMHMMSVYVRPSMVNCGVWVTSVLMLSMELLSDWATVEVSAL